MDFIRKHRTLFSTVFVVSAAGLVLTMFGKGAGSGGGAFMSSDAAAKVDGEEITTRELAINLDRQYREAESAIQAQAKGNPESRKFMEQFLRSRVNPDSVLQQLIQKRFLVAVASRQGMQASPEAIRDLIQSDPEFQKDGAFNALTYRQRVEKPGLYEKDLSKQIKFMNFSRSFESGLALVSPLEKSEEEIFETKYVFDSLSLDPKTFPEPKSVSAEEVKTYIGVAGNEAKVKAYFEQHKAEFEVPEKVHARHILLRDEKDAENKIRDIRKEIEGGKLSFADAAKKYSADPSNASKGGDLGFFTADAMDAAFSQAAFALKAKDEISQPVKSAFGFHLIQFVARQGAQKKTFDELKVSLAEKVLLDEKKNANAKAWLEKFKTSPSDADLKRLGLSWVKQPEWSPLQERLGSVGNVQGHLDAILKLNLSDRRYLSQPITQGDKFILLKLTEIKRPQDPSVLKEKEKAAPAVASVKNEGKQEAEKAQGAFQFYLQRKFEKMEADKKIVKSEKVLAKLRKQVTEGR